MRMKNPRLSEKGMIIHRANVKPSEKTELGAVFQMKISS